MTVKTDCDALRELIPAYSLGATDNLETQQVELGLLECPDLQAEWMDYQQQLAHIGTLVPQLTPPPHVLSNILERARAKPTVLPRRRVRWQLVAVACLALLLVVSNIFWLNQTRSLQQQLARLGSTKVLYLPTATNGQAYQSVGRVLWSPDADKGLLLVENFPLPPNTDTYQVWITRDGSVTSLGVFTVSEAGQGSLVIAANDLNEPFDALGVTLEPNTGSSAPTSAPLVRWKKR